MGRPKALLPAGPAGPSFVRRLSDSLLAGGVADVIVVGRPDDRRAARRKWRASAPACDSSSTRTPRQGQLSSVIAGLNAADRPGVHGVLVTPVDSPLVLPDTVRALLTVFRDHVASAIVRATCHGRHGHPVIFGRGVFDALRHADPAVGRRLLSTRMRQTSSMSRSTIPACCTTSTSRTTTPACSIGRCERQLNDGPRRRPWDAIGTSLIDSYS